MKRLPLLAMVAWLAGAAACTRAESGASASASTPAPAKYLYVFAGYSSGKAPNYHAHDAVRDATLPSDFVAVIDVDSASPTYAQVLRVMPTGAGGSMPHHTEMVMPDSGWPFAANAHLIDATYLVDVTEAIVPRIAGQIEAVPGFRRPHSFARLPNGDLLGTYQYGDRSVKGDPGALARFTREGRLLAFRSAADPAFAGQALRTYSLDVHPGRDRVLTTSVSMDINETGTADVVQLWRLSDLRLIKTITLPVPPGDSSARYPFEVRFLGDGQSALVNTDYCGFFLLTGLDGDAPRAERVLALQRPARTGCAVPLLLGRWWIMPVTSSHEFIVYDVSNPRHPREAGVLAADSTFTPHWIARDPGSDRLVMTAEGPQPSVRLARFDTTTGQLSWDTHFREQPAGPLGVRFDRAVWPGGAPGRAAPHGALFSRR